MADAVKAAMKPYGYDVQICYYCAGGPRAARLVGGGSDVPVPEKVTSETLPTPSGKLDFGATGTELLQYAYLGIHEFAPDKEGPRRHLRLLANIQIPSYFMVAVNARSKIVDLRQIAEKRLAVKLIARGGIDDPINQAFLDYYGLSEAKIKEFGGTATSRYARGSEVDVIIGWAALNGSPEHAVWYDAPQQHDFTYLDLPDDLRTKLAKDFFVEAGAAPIALLRGVTRRLQTVAREGTAVYGRADMPDDFAYTVAKALDEQKGVLRWSHMPFSYNEKTVWKLGSVPLHPGAARYYKERGYIR